MSADTPAGDHGRDPVRRAGDAQTVRRVFDQMPLMVTAMEGPDPRFTAITAMYRAYIGRQEIIGRPLREAFIDIAGEHITEMYERVYATGRAESLRDFRVQIDRPGQTQHVEYFVDFTISPFYGSDGRVTGVIVCAEDVTARVREREATQARAAEVQRRYEQARDVIDALQRELLPGGVPVLPRLEVAASYLLADVETAAGGDWFDALALDDGRVALVAGDVVGHGISASATMGQLRVLLRERLSATGDLLTALDALNMAAGWIPGARAATVCVALLDPITGALSYCTAGHPAPLLLPVDGEAGFLPTTGAGPLGVGGAFTGELVGTATLDPGAMVLLYTDGILERPERSLAQSSVELAQVAAGVAADRAPREHEPRPAERVCTQTLELLTRVTGNSDDITLLAGRRVDAPEPLRLTIPADLGQLQPLRTRLGEWLAGCGVEAGDDGAVRHAVVELVTNSIEHAYLDRVDAGTTCEITATLRANGNLRARVRDHGAWREPRRSPERGLGLQVASGMVDTLQIEHDDHGTTATIEHTLTRPARLLTADNLHAGHPVPRPAPADPLLVLDEPWAPGPRIRVDGPVDATTADQVEGALREAGSAGTRDLTVDLTGVSHLASAGVAVLHRVAAAHRRNGTTLRLYAPTASPADTVLTLVGLDHLTRDPHTPGRA